MPSFRSGAGRFSPRPSRPRPAEPHRPAALVIAFAAVLLGAGGHVPATAQPAGSPATVFGDLDPAQPLSLEQALRLAQQRSSALAAQEAAASAARDMAAAARTLPDPTLRLAIQNLPIEGPDRFSLTRDFMTMRAIGVMQELTRADKRAARAVRFEREADVAQAARTVQLATLRREAAIAWLERYYQERMLELLRQQRNETQLQVEAADTAYRARRGSQADVFMARAAVAQLDDRLHQTRAQLANARTTLARWVGGAAELPLAEPPALSRLQFDAERLTAQLDHHPEIALMTRREAVARAEAEVARQERYPDWSVELMYGRRGPGFGDMVSVGVSVPLPWNRAQRQDRELAARLALAEQLRAEREETARQHLAETERWLQTWRSLLERVEHYARRLEPLAAERTRAALAGYQGGAEPLDAVLQARRMEIDTRMERLRLEMDAAALWAQLEYLVAGEHAATQDSTPSNKAAEVAR